ncbi:hypothetical protein HA402_009088 [Bradysia odoriphaga]|nr:hypothetical protein HA402_009088 [Bradysia odoriphaga]
MIAIVLTLLVAVVTTIYYYSKVKYSFWKKHNIPYIEPHLPYGNIKGVGRTLHSSQLTHKFYKQLKGSGPFAGIYLFTKPVILALDLEFVKTILIKDFNYFQDRGLYFNERDDPISAHLFSVDFARWKVLRAKLTPTFTSGRMKFMFQTIVDVADNFQKCLAGMVDGNENFELKDVLSRFTTDVIGTCAFGINCNSLTDPNAEFRTMGKRVFDHGSTSGMLKHFFKSAFKHLAITLRMRAVDKDVSTFFLGIVKETVEYREKNDVKRNDFMDLLIQLKNHGTLDGADVGKLSLNEIAAQAFVFFIAGFETASTTLSFILYELSINKHLQERARQEIHTVLAKHNGQFTYEAMMSMNYLGQCIHESLRKYPPGNLIRTNVNKEYPIPNTDIVMPKESLVIVPVYAIHHDTDYYTNPDEYNPDRFEPEEVKKRHPQTFMPFGDGPRNCAGVRFGMMQIRIGLVTLLKNFEFSLCDRTIMPIRFAPGNLVLSIEHDLWLNVKNIAN